MKKIRDYIHDDMFNHILMSGPAIEKYFDPAEGMTLKEKHEYDQGIFCTYPFMMLANYCNWKYDAEEPAPRPYADFMNEAMPRLQAKVFPLIAPAFDEENPLPESKRGEILIPVLTDIIPTFVLTEFYNYMYPNAEKDISELLEQLKPMLQGVVAEVLLPAAYSDEKPMDWRVKTEVFKFVALRMAAFCMKRYHDWHFGAEVMAMGPPPGGPDGEGPGGPGGPGPGGPPPQH